MEATAADGFACEIKPDSPHISHRWHKKTGELHIDGKVKFHCRVAVQVHRIEASLQRGTKAGWRTMASDVDTRVPPPTEDRLTFMVVYEDCETGLWQARIKVSDVYQGTTNRGETVSPSHYIDCGHFDR